VNYRVVFLRCHQRKSGNLVDEDPHYVPERTKNKLYLALAFMILLIYVIYIVVTPLGSPSLDYLEEPTHNITIWTEPMNHTFHMRFEFYSSPQDAISETNRLSGSAPMVGPNTTTGEDVVYGLLQTIDLFWIRVGYAPQTNEDLLEWSYGLYALRIGEHLRIHLSGHEFTILVTRAQTQ
jgi:hypothetical protein